MFRLLLKAPPDTRAQARWHTQRSFLFRPHSTYQDDVCLMKTYGAILSTFRPYFQIVVLGCVRACKRKRERERERRAYILRQIGKFGLTSVLPHPSISFVSFFFLNPRVRVPSELSVCLLYLLFQPPNAYPPIELCTNTAVCIVDGCSRACHGCVVCMGVLLCMNRCDCQVKNLHERGN